MTQYFTLSVFYILTPSLIGLIGLTLLSFYLINSLDLGYVSSLTVCLSLFGLTLYLTRDPISVLIVFLLFSVLILFDTSTIKKDSGV